MRLIEFSEKCCFMMGLLFQSILLLHCVLCKLLYVKEQNPLFRSWLELVWLFWISKGHRSNSYLEIFWNDIWTILSPSFSSKGVYPCLINMTDILAVYPECMVPIEFRTAMPYLVANTDMGLIMASQNGGSFSAIPVKILMRLTKCKITLNLKIHVLNHYCRS